MKVISLLQPWATLVVMGMKKIETRSWNTKHRGPLLIHASAGKTMGLPVEQRTAFLGQVYNKMAPDAPAFAKLPFGAIIGSVSLDHTFSSDVADAFFYEEAEFFARTEKEWEKAVEIEKAFGNYSVGRWCWQLSEPVCYAEPKPAKGGLGLWNFVNQR